MNSYTEENYLKAIYSLIDKGENVVSTNALAMKMNTKAASVTDMLKKLSDKKLINYQKYQGVTLSVLGEQVALMVIRKHRLWEMFLVEKLDFKWDEVHDVAEQLEHIHSDKLIDQLDKYLNYPKTDPHGDPIPDANGKLKVKKSIALSKLKKNDTCIMIGVADHSSSFLQFLDTSGITLGVEIKIKKIIDFDSSIQITVNKQLPLFISHKAAKSILVQPLL